MSQTEQALNLALRASHMCGDYAQEELDYYLPKWIHNGANICLYIGGCDHGVFAKCFMDKPLRFSHATLKVEVTRISVGIDCYYHTADKLMFPTDGFLVMRGRVELKRRRNGYRNLAMPDPTIRRLVVDFCRILNTCLDDSPLEEATRNTFRATIAKFESKVEMLLADARQ